MEYPPAPWDFANADFMRKNTQEAIYACAFCVREDQKRRYWPVEDLKFIRYRLACPKHYQQHKED